MSLFPYFSEYFKINHFALYLLLFYAFLVSLKYQRFKFTTRQLILGAFFGGLFLRLAWLSFSSHTPQMVWMPNASEGDWINRHAIEITKGTWFHGPDGLPAGRRPIGYPLALGLLYNFLGVNLNVVWGFHLALYAVTFVLVHKMTRFIFGERESVLAAFLWALYPVSIYSIKLITDEHLFLPLWYAGLYFLFKEVEGKRVPFAFLWYGIIFGYAAMTRTHAIFMPLVVGWTYFLIKRSWRLILLGAAGTLLVMQLVNAPWILRNYRVWGVPVLYVPVSCFMYAQVNATALAEEGGGHLPGPDDEGYNPAIQKAQAEGKEAVAHQLCNKEMKRWMITHPVDFLFMGTRRLLVFMNWNRKGGVWPLWFQTMDGHFDPARPLTGKLKKTLEEAAFASYYGILFSFLFSLAAITFGWKKLEAKGQKGILILLACFSFWWGEHLIIYADRKYRYPIEPLMMILAAYFLSKVMDFPIKEIFRQILARKKSQKVNVHG